MIPAGCIGDMRRQDPFQLRSQVPVGVIGLVQLTFHWGCDEILEMDSSNVDVDSAHDVFAARPPRQTSDRNPNESIDIVAYELEMVPASHPNLGQLVTLPYDLEWWTEDKGFRVLSAEGNIRRFTLGGLLPGCMYHFRMRAMLSNGSWSHSRWSKSCSTHIPNVPDVCSVVFRVPPVPKTSFHLPANGTVPMWLSSCTLGSGSYTLFIQINNPVDLHISNVDGTAEQSLSGKGYVGQRQWCFELTAPQQIQIQLSAKNCPVCGELWLERKPPKNATTPDSTSIPPGRMPLLRSVSEQQREESERRQWTETERYMAESTMQEALHEHKVQAKRSASIPSSVDAALLAEQRVLDLIGMGEAKKQLRAIERIVRHQLINEYCLSTPSPKNSRFRSP